VAIVTARCSDRPELWAQTNEISEEVWPEYNRHGAVLGLYWGRLRDELPDFQFVLYDEERDEVLAEGHTAPCSWDGTVTGLGAGIDEMITAAGAASRRNEKSPGPVSAGPGDLLFRGSSTTASVAGDFCIGPTAHMEGRLSSMKGRVMSRGAPRVAAVFGVLVLVMVGFLGG
jgi:hypothetical protein